jgi:hypothetical protein
VPRRVSLPGASELFRPTHTGSDQLAEPDRNGRDRQAATFGASRTSGSGSISGSGRIRHDEKITVYVSSDELLALEQARLTLRARHSKAVDRGRIVREAISVVLADFSLNGDNSELVRRLSRP